MSNQKDDVQLDALFAALASTRRRNMLHELALRPATVSQLAKQFGLSLPAIHKHIAILEAAELIIRKKVGRTNFVALNSQRLGVAKKWVLQYHTEWGQPQATLENYISKMLE